MKLRRPRWGEASLVTRITLLYTLLLATVLVVVAMVVAGTLSRWIEADSLGQLSMQAQEVRVALAAAAQSNEPFTVSATRVLNDVLGRDVQASVWASDGHLIARSEGFYFPQEKLPPDQALAPDGNLPFRSGADAVEVSPKPAGVPTVKTAAPDSRLPARPALASPDVIGTESNQVYLNLSMVRSAVTLNGADRVAMLVTTLGGVPDDLVATSHAYPDVPPLNLPAFPNAPQRRPLLALTTSLNRETEGLSMVLTVLAIAGGAALVLGGLIARRIVHRGLRPVDGLAAASQRLAAGDLSVRVPIPPGKNELSRLAHSFNEMAGQLDSAFTAQRSFVADASHELRTPLAALRGQVDVMRRALSEQPEDADRLATSMRRELARLSRLVDDLLVLARLDALGSAALAPRSIDMCSVAEDVCAQVSALPTAKGCDVRIETEGPVRIKADGERLHQVLLNLLANAVEHTPAGGKATVTVAASAGGAHVEVRDTGPGIDSAHLPKIFDRFYRADGVRRRVNGTNNAGTDGAGLGLAIARAIVEAHGGTIAAANCPTGGAVFTVEIPSHP